MKKLICSACAVVMVSCASAEAMMQESNGLLSMGENGYYGNDFFQLQFESGFLRGKELADLHRAEGAGSFRGFMQFLGDESRIYIESNVPAVVGVWSGYKSTFPEMYDELKSKILEPLSYFSAETLLIYNIFYRSLIGGNAVLDPEKFNVTDIDLFDRVAAAIGLSDGAIDFGKFSDVMKIIHLEAVRGLAGACPEYGILVPAGNFREKLKAVIAK